MSFILGPLGCDHSIFRPIPLSWAATHSEQRMSTPRPVILITGAARRLGAAIARRLHAAGCDLALHYHTSGAALACVQDELEGRRAGGTLALRADLADSDRLPDLVTATVERFGRLDGLVNNASAFFPTPIGKATAADWDALFASNARAPFFLAQAAAPHLKAAAGAIVNMSDIYSERPLPRHGIYCMAKAALSMATRSLALELAPEVRVNAIAPGAILWAENETDVAKQQALLERTPLGRTGTPEEIAEAVRWLLVDATYVTGQVLRVDGGRLIAD